MTAPPLAAGGEWFYVDRLSAEHREQVARRHLDSLRYPDGRILNGAEVIAVLEIELKLARAEQRRANRIWAGFSREVDMGRKAGLTLSEALHQTDAARRRLTPEEALRERDDEIRMSSLERRYREEKARCGGNHK